MKDAADICTNLFSQNTLEQTQVRLAENLQKVAQGQMRHIVAEFKCDPGLVSACFDYREEEHAAEDHKEEQPDPNEDQDLSATFRA